MKLTRERRFIREFRARHPLRLHMAAILLATGCSGVLASKALLAAGLESLPLRYPLAVLLAYLVFFICVRLWLLYVARQNSGNVSRLADLVDGPVSSLSPSGAPGPGGVSAFRSGGGQFGGGGASSSLDAGTSGVGQPLADVGGAASDATGGLGEAVGEAAGALGDEGGLVVGLVLLALVTLVGTILGTTIYLVYEAPVILAEAAFEGFLAAALIRGASRIGRGDWVGSVFSATWKPFLVTLLLALAGGSIVSFYFPTARRISELFQ